MPRQPAKTNTRARLQATASSSAQRPSLLTIPLELREEIYTRLLPDTSSTLFNLLTVNRRLTREIKPFLYKRPHFFDGQRILFDWLDQVDHDYLRFVTDIRFKLLDINPETIVGALGKRLREANVTRDRPGPETEDNPYYQACFLELKHVQKAFGMLSAVKELTIVTCTASDPQPPPQMVDGFSKLLGHCFSDLRSLISEEKLFPVDFLRNKPRLRRLRFPANSESNEDDIASVFKRLTDLELEICRLPPPSGLAYEWGCMSEILPYVPPLRRLVLFESLKSDPPTLSEEVFVDSIEAMKRHLRSLRKLTLLADSPARPQEAGLMRRNLLRFVEASSLRHVEVLGTYASIYRHLPGTTESFTLRLDRESTPPISFTTAMTDLMSHVKFRALSAAKDPHIPRLSRLREIQVRMSRNPGRPDHEDSDEDSDDDDDDDDDEEDIVDAFRSRLHKIGIKFTLVVDADAKDRMTGSEEHL